MLFSVLKSRKAENTSKECNNNSGTIQPKGLQPVPSTVPRHTNMSSLQAALPTYLAMIMRDISSGNNARLVKVYSSGVLAFFSFSFS